MNRTLYYGEICAMIAGLINQKPEDRERITEVINQNGDQLDSIWTLCAEAARVFDEIETGCENHFMDAPKAIEIFAGHLRDSLLRGEFPWPLELYSLATNSIQETM